MSYQLWNIPNSATYNTFHSKQVLFFIWLQLIGQSEVSHICHINIASPIRITELHLSI